MNPLQVSQYGPYGERCPFTEIKKFFPSLKGPRKGAFLLVFQKRGPYGNRRPFPLTYLAYSSGSPVKEPSLPVPLIELLWREMPHS